MISQKTKKLQKQSKISTFGPPSLRKRILRLSAFFRIFSFTSTFYSLDDPIGWSLLRVKSQGAREEKPTGINIV
jgi:hypothetical protein